MTLTTPETLSALDAEVTGKGRRLPGRRLGRPTGNSAGVTRRRSPSRRIVDIVLIAVLSIGGIVMIAGLTVSGFCSQFGPSMPKRASTWFTRPKSPLYAHCHRIATAARHEITATK